MKTEISFAIIGCGRIAERHAKHINNVGKLIAVCDMVEAKAKKLADIYQAKYYHSIDELLLHHQPTVVAVCTPNGLHAQHSIKAMQAGCHVVCEKPMAINTKDCEAMITAAEQSNKQLFIVKQNRFNPPVVAVKNAIDNGVLGKIFSFQLNCFWNRDAAYYIDGWRGTNQLDGGTLFTQFSHFIDLIYWFLGDVKNVQAIGKNYAHQNIIEFEDTGIVLIELESGVIGSVNYTVNSFQKNMEGSITIFAENGTVKIGGEYLNTLDYSLVKDFSFGNLPRGNEANDYGAYKGSMSNHDKIYENVIDVLNNNASISTNAYEGMKTVAIIENIYAKIANK